MSIYEQFSQTELDILQARAARAAQSTDKDQQVDELSTLVIHVRNETYALPVDYLSSVYADVAVTAVPCTPDYVAGIANLRGHMVPVLELAEILGIPGQSANRTNSLVVAATQKTTIALRVDVIGEVMTVGRQALASVPAAFSGEQSNYVSGILPGDVALVDLAALLDDPALVVSETLL